MTTKTTPTTLWEEVAPAEDAPRLPRSTRGAWRPPTGTQRRAPERPRQAQLPGLDDASAEDADLEEVDADVAAPVRAPRARRRTVPRASAGNDLREFPPVRRRLLPRGRVGWIAFGLTASFLLALLVTTAILFRRYLLHDLHFRLDSSSQVTTLTPASGDQAQVSRSEILSVFGQDIGRNIFFVPLAERRRELEAIPWVRQATVMRILPNRIFVSLAERTPIAFARVGDTVELVDADGVLLPISPSRMAIHPYSFPVVTGLRVHPAMASPHERMALYQRFIADLDHVQPHASAQVSEIDLSDPDDLRATLSDGGSDLLVHFGADDFAARYQMYLTHIAEWHAHYPRLSGIDLRFSGDVPLELAPETASQTTRTTVVASHPASVVKAAQTAVVGSNAIAIHAVQSRPVRTNLVPPSAIRKGVTKTATHKNSLHRHSIPASKPHRLAEHRMVSRRHSRHAALPSTHTAHVANQVSATSQRGAQ